MVEVTYINHTDTNYTEEELSSAVWVILFSFLILLSSCANTLFLVGVVCSRKISKVYLFLVFCFLINIVEYVLLVVELSGPYYPYSELSCTVYQLLLHILPLLSSWILVILVSSQASLLLPLSTLLLTISTPIILYSCLAIYPNGDRYCVIDLVTMVNWLGINMEKQQMITSFFFIIIKPLLSFFIPLILLLISIIKKNKYENCNLDEKTNTTLIRTIIVSYGVFYFPYFSAVLIRHLLVIFSTSPSARDKWLLDIFQSLFHLISYFFHVFRPMVCLVLDTDIITAFYRSSYKLIIDREKKNDLNKR